MVTAQPITDRFWSKVDIRGPEDCWLWTARVSRCGQAWFFLREVKGKVLATSAHRFSWELAHGPIPDGLYVCHHCDIPHCVNPRHLFLGTQSDNMVDAVSKGRIANGNNHGLRKHPERIAHGERHGRAKLTEVMVKAIRSDPRSNIALGRVYGVSAMTISRARSRECWKHLA